MAYAVKLEYLGMNSHALNYGRLSRVGDNRLAADSWSGGNSEPHEAMRASGVSTWTTALEVDKLNEVRADHLTAYVRWLVDA